MGLGGGASAATIIVTILFFAANDQSCVDAAAAGNKSNRTIIANFQFDHNDMLFSKADSTVARTKTLNADKVVIDCARPGPYKPCTPDPQHSKKGEHCSPPPGGLYLNRGCPH